MREDMMAVLGTRPFYAIFDHSAEIYYQEYVAGLFGRRNGGRVEVVNAGLYRSVKCTNNNVYSNNTRAEGRLSWMNEAVNARKRTRIIHDLRDGSGTVEVAKRRKYYKIGEVHPHPHPRDTCSVSRDDVDSIRREMEKMGQDHWLELVVAIRRKEYAEEHESEEEFTQWKRRLRAIVRSGREGYDMRFAAHYFELDGGRLLHREIPLWVPTIYKDLEY